MKAVSLIALLLCCGCANKSTTEECKALSAFAHTTMLARQNGANINEVRNSRVDTPQRRQIITAAFRIDRFKSKEWREGTAVMFAEVTFDMCQAGEL